MGIDGGVAGLKYGPALVCAETPNAVVVPVGDGIVEYVDAVLQIELGHTHSRNYGRCGRLAYNFVLRRGFETMVLSSVCSITFRSEGRLVPSQLHYIIRHNRVLMAMITTHSDQALAH